MLGIFLVWGTACLGLLFWPPFEDAFKLPQFCLCILMPFFAVAAGGSLRPGALRTGVFLLVGLHLAGYAVHKEARFADLAWFVSLALLAPLAAEAIRVRGRTLGEKMAAALCLAGGLSALLSVVQFAGFDPGGKAGVAGMRPFSTMGNPDFLAAYLLAVLPVCVLVWLRNGKFWPGAAAFLSGAGLLLSQSRGAWLGAAASAAAGGALYFVRPESFRTTRARLAAGAAGAVLLASFLAFHQPARERLMRIADARHFDARGRMAMWKASLWMIRERPLAGRGLGSFGKAYPEFHARLSADDPSLPFFYTENAHNDYLEMAAEEGLPVLGLMVWLWAVFARTAWRNFKGGDVLSLGLLLGFVGMQVNALFNFPWHLIPVQAWFWTAFAVVWARRKGAEERPQRREATPSAGPVLCAAACAGLLVVCARDLRSNALLKISGDALASSQWHAALRAADLSLERWLFWENKFRAANNASVAAYQAGDLDSAERYARLSASMNPSMPFPWGQIGLIRARRGDYAGAREALSRATAIYRDHPESLHVLGNIAVMEEDFKAAEEYWSRALKVNPGYASVRESLESLRKAKGKEGR